MEDRELADVPVCRRLRTKMYYVDTARVYQQGNNERMVGAALKRKRKDVVLSTKSISRDKQGALADLDTSLKELGTDYVDIWYLHLKNTPADVTDDLLEAQRIAKQQGKIRFAGVSTHEGYRELIPLLARKGLHRALPLRGSGRGPREPSAGAVRMRTATIGKAKVANQ